MLRLVTSKCIIGENKRRPLPQIFTDLLWLLNAAQSRSQCTVDYPRADGSLPR